MAGRRPAPLQYGPPPTGSDRSYISRPLLPTLDSQVDLHPLTILLRYPVLLTERESLPAIGQKNAAQVRVPVKADAKHVVTLALEPVRRSPEWHDCGYGITVFNYCLHAHTFV